VRPVCYERPRMDEQEERETERRAGRALAVIVVVSVIVIVLFWLVGYDALRDAVG
jgi:hypothetical protein